FNFLGPLANPAGVRRRVLGVSDPSMAERMAHTLAELGVERAMVFCGADGLDELTTTTISNVWELTNGSVRTSTVDPAEYGIPAADADEIVGGAAAANVAIAEPTAVLPPRPAPAAAPVAASAPKAARRAKAPRSSAGASPTDAIAMPLRVLAWVVSLVLGLVVTIWVARVTGWLSGDRLVDVFVGTGMTRYIRVIAVAPVWAMFTTLLLTLFLEGGRALARRRAEKRTAAKDSQRGAQRGERERFDGG